VRVSLNRQKNVAYFDLTEFSGTLARAARLRRGRKLLP
jgi:hypothetical protein